MGEQKRRFAATQSRVTRAQSEGRYTTHLDVLDAWDLLSLSPPTQKLTIGEWEKIGEALHTAHSEPPEATPGTVTFGLNESAGFADGRQPLEKLINHALMADAVWLPDPVYSVLSSAAANAHMRFGNPPPFTLGGTLVYVTGSQCMWTKPTAERLGEVRKHLPAMLARLREMRPLLEAGAVRLAPWEVPASSFEQEILDSAIEFVGNPTTREIAERHRQDQYTLGVYCGGFGATAEDGSPVWIDQKLPVATYGMLNAAYASSTGAAFMPKHEGDRDVFDFIMMGQAASARHELPLHVDLPRFSRAVLPDFVNVRRDSESLASLRVLIRDAAKMNGEQIEDALEARLREVAEKIRQDSKLWRLTGAQVVEMTVGFAGAVIVGGLTSSSLASALAGAGPALVALMRAIGSRNRRAGRGRAELLLRVAERMEK